MTESVNQAFWIGFFEPKQIKKHRSKSKMVKKM